MKFQRISDSPLPASMYDAALAVMLLVVFHFYNTFALVAFPLAAFALAVNKSKLQCTL